MTSTITFPTGGPLPSVEGVAAWLTEHGEPFESEVPDTLALRAVPLRVTLSPSGVRATVNITTSTPLSRLVRLVFDLSMHIGADVHLLGEGEVRRPELWMRLADQQDRLRIADALDKAAAHNVRDEMLTGFWSLLAALDKRRDLRWDFHKRAIVEVREAARTSDDDDEPSDALPDDVLVPIREPLHVLAWRWMAESYPSLASG